MFKTILPVEIASIEDAKKFLTQLHDNGELFHPEDNAEEIEWLGLPEDQHPTIEQCTQLNKLMSDIYNLPGNNDGTNIPLIFDPCQYSLDLRIRFLVKDKTGRGYKVTRSLAELKDWDEIKDDEELIEWLENADDGDDRDERTMKFIRVD